MLTPELFETLLDDFDQSCRDLGWAYAQGSAIDESKAHAEYTAARQRLRDAVFPKTEPTEKPIE